MKKGIINFSVGDIVNFGEYHGPIEWIVLERVEKELLMITRYGIENIAFSYAGMKTTWENSELRRWLNNDFYNMAFNNDLKKLIVKKKVLPEVNPYKNSNPGNTTEDMIFALSVSETEKYLSYEQIKCKVFKRTENPNENYLDDNGLWWLRTPGTTNLFSCVAGEVGYYSKTITEKPSFYRCLHEDDRKVYPAINLAGQRVGSDGPYARPALWINIESLL